MARYLNFTSTLFILILFIISGCQIKKGKDQKTEVEEETTSVEPRSISEPLVSHIYTADPSAHVFDGKLYIYPSHDVEAGIPADDKGSHFDMRDYHVLSMQTIGGDVTDHGVILDINDILWAGRQLWAPDAAYHSGQYYLYFPAKDKEGIFRIGVAISDSPSGPFKPEPSPIKESFSIDPAVFRDPDGTYYMYFGGIWGGQLERWRTGQYDVNGKEPGTGEPALLPKVARLSKNMLAFDEPVRDVQILDENGNPLLAGDNNRRFFEAAWMHNYNNNYYFSYSTGDTHFIAYAIGDNPYGPFTYQGVILNPVIGWTNHHSIVEYKGKWYLFYHDSSLSNGQTHLRCVKVTELTYNSDGSIQTIDPYIR